MNIGAIRDAIRVERTCKICGNRSKYVLSMNNEHGAPHVLEIFLCSYCGLLFVGNPITDDLLSYAYSTLDTRKYYREVASTSEEKISQALNDVNSLMRSFANYPTVLDVGCGYGHFLSALTKSHSSIRAVGHELPGDSASVCKSKGFKVFTCNLEDISDKFSVITLLDVAEHVPQPNLIFAACYSLLKKDGYIYIHTPRRCFWDNLFLALIKMPGFRKMSRAWLRTRVSIFHLHLWTDKALKLSLQKAGFQLVYLKSKMELSWPLDRYTKLYLGEIFHFPPLLVKMATGLANILFVWLGTLRNKSICLVQKRHNLPKSSYIYQTKKA